MGGGGDHQARSPPSDDVTHAYRTQRGNRAITRASNISMCLAAAICRVMGGVPHIYAKAAPGGFQHNIALISSPFWDDKALKSVPSGSTGGSPIYDHPRQGRYGQDYPHLRKSQRKGSPPEEQERPPPDTFYFYLKNTSYVAPGRQTVSGSQDGHPLLRVAPTSLPIRRRKICGGFLRVAKLNTRNLRRRVSSEGGELR